MTKKFNNFAKVCALVPIDTKLWRLLFEGVPCNSHSRQYGDLKRPESLNNEVLNMAGKKSTNAEEDSDTRYIILN